MIISLKDGLKLFGITIVSFCAVFVCTFMLNYYLDVLPLADLVTEEMQALYNAQCAQAQFTTIITGGILGITAAIMLVFYIKLFIDEHAAQLGVLKALGYTRGRIAVQFSLFALSVFLGCALGFGVSWAYMHPIYDTMTIEGMQVPMNFHYELLVFFVLAPTLFFGAIACLYPYFALRRPAVDMMYGRTREKKVKREKNSKERSFLTEICFSVLGTKRLLAFFVFFSCFCFSAMVQMGLSMDNLVKGSMGYMILGIGLVLAFVSAIMSVTALIHANEKTISLLKAFGYPLRHCVAAVFLGFLPFALLGFAVGSAYQYGLLQIMINIVFANVEGVPEYSFNVPMFFVTLALFLASYSVILGYYILRVKKISVKEIMTEI